MFEGLGLILTVMIGGFTLLFALLLVLWHHFNNRFDKVDARFEKMDGRFDKLESKLATLEMDMVQIKTILHMKDCCMIKDDRQMKKAE